MDQTRFRKASSCFSRISLGALACRSVSKLCLSRPPIRLSSATVLRSVCATSGLPPKKRRRMYSDSDSPAISACSTRRVFSLSVTRIVTYFRAALRPPSSVFPSFMSFAFGLREAKCRAVRESRGRQPSGRMGLWCSTTPILPRRTRLVQWPNCIYGEISCMLAALFPKEEMLWPRTRQSVLSR